MDKGRELGLLRAFKGVLHSDLQPRKRLLLLLETAEPMVRRLLSSKGLDQTRD